ncbi:MAG: glutathione-dependent reductase [Rhodospirillaceae bacterium TMED140]|nr:glutathione-dependent reductase [Rhodospirillaceae bacterium]OUX68121.1 MAG: glutathione-dependent reductase [Rhodospirillaceae bacterium TMED140]
MGLLVDGKWVDQWYDTKSTGGRFKRKASAFRDWIQADGSTAFAPESGRYHLYVSYACPWAHRTLIYRRLKGLEDHISVSVVNPIMLEHGWTFEPGDGVVPDPFHSAEFLHQVYTAAKVDYSGRVTVPVLWDRQHATIVSNESAEIIRMFDEEFGGITGQTAAYRPADLVDEIDALNDRIYTSLNNGVYKAGFATSQAVYLEEVTRLFEVLDEMEERLATRRYLTGNRVTEADWRFLPTLLRFDPVYVGHFKCNLRRIVDYSNIQNYMLDLVQQHGLIDTFNLDHVKRHYYVSHTSINPTQVVPEGPVIDLTAPHDRDRLPRAA